MIHLLPGMGADERMFPGPWRKLPGVSFVRWPSYQGEESIVGLAERIIRLQGIQNGDILVGSSLGGMVACEIARRCKVRSLFLVASATHPLEINSILRLIHPVADLTPMAIVRQLAGIIPTATARMFHDGDPAFIRAMCRAAFAWEGMSDDERRKTALPFFRIHGKHDAVIPLPSDVDTVLEAGHLAAMTHAEECVAFIREKLGRS